MSQKFWGLGKAVGTALGVLGGATAFLQRWEVVDTQGNSYGSYFLAHSARGDASMWNDDDMFLGNPRTYSAVWKGTPR